jgi:hypothetical protein
VCPEVGTSQPVFPHLQRPEKGSRLCTGQWKQLPCTVPKGQGNRIGHQWRLFSCGLLFLYCKTGSVSVAKDDLELSILLSLKCGDYRREVSHPAFTVGLNQVRVVPFNSIYNMKLSFLFPVFLEAIQLPQYFLLCIFVGEKTFLLSFM